MRFEDRLQERYLPGGLRSSGSLTSAIGDRLAGAEESPQLLRQLERILRDQLGRLRRPDPVPGSPKLFDEPDNFGGTAVVAQFVAERACPIHI